MKKNTMILAIALCLGFCTMNATNQTISEKYTLTEKGVGPIVLGMNVDKIPASVTDLYDRIEKVSTPDAEAILFYNGEDVIFSLEYDETDGTVYMVCISDYSPITNSTKSGDTCVEK